MKNKVPSPKIKKDDSLRKAQIMPWFETVKKIGNPVIAAYLQGLILTGARRNELATLRWQDVDFQVGKGAHHTANPLSGTFDSRPAPP